MKYVCFWEYDKKDEAALFEKLPYKGELNRLLPSYSIGGRTRGFTVVEEEDFEKIEKHYHHLAPLVQVEVLPIIELDKVSKIRKYLSKLFKNP